MASAAMKRADAGFLLSLLLLALALGVPSAVEDAEEAKLKAADGMQEAKEATGTWANWARDKLTEGWGANNAEGITMKTTEKLADAAHGAADIASQKTSDAKDTIMTGAGNAKDNLIKAGEATGQKMGDYSNQAADKAGKAYEGAKQKLGEAYEAASDNMGAAKETMTESAKSNYAASKEKASQAVGDMGTRMEEL